MGDISGGIARVDGRQILLAIGGLFIAVAAGSPLLHVVEGRVFEDILVIAILASSSGLGVLYSVYRLPQTDIRPDLYGVIAKWCLSTIGVLLGILLLVELVTEIDDPVLTILILTPLASIAGLGMGIHDATARTRARNAEEQRQEAERYSRELERQNRRLESFASMLAHELRNPVNIGQIYSQQLPAETESEAVKYVTEAFDRIEDMIDVMLVLARGREAVGGGDSVRLADVSREVWEDMNAPEATLEVDTDATVQADETALRHLFVNLFENAVEHGRMDVTVSVGDLPTGFYVADDGPGIPTDERDTVFDAGYTTAGGQGGTGLGLAFVRELAEVYEWGVSVTESESGGARFEFTDVSMMCRVTE